MVRESLHMTNDKAVESTKADVNSFLPGPLALLARSWRLVKRASGRLLALIVLSQLIIVLVASPLVAWLLRRALRAGGFYAVDINAFNLTPGLGLTAVILLVLMLLVTWLVIIQFSAIVVVLRHPEYSWHELLGALAHILRRALRPSSWRMAVYLLLVLPLSGFGFISTLIGGVHVPSFITGELQKTPLYATILTVLTLVLAYANIRCGLALPIFATTELTGNSSLKHSWHATRGFRPWSIVISVIVLLTVTGGILTASFYLLLLPTKIADRTSPNLSWLFAAAGLGIGQVVTILVIGYAVSVLAGILMIYAAGKGKIPEEEAQEDGRTITATYSAGRVSQRITAATILIAIVVGTVASVPVMRNIADHPSTLVVAHRGWTAKSVENTIESLQAATNLGADLVELDVMRTADNQFVVFHDTTLTRLSSSRGRVADLTLEELTAVTLRDPAGYEGQIPSLVDYATKAKELGQPLLIELKLSGAEPEAKQNVADLIRVLDENDLLDGNMFQSIDWDSTQELKKQLPDAPVGYVMPFAGLALPDTLADFLVLEQSSATDLMRELADRAGLGYVVWTVNTEDAMRRRFHEDIDALITNYPDVALELREKIGLQSGLAGRLRDIMALTLFPF